MKIFLDTADVDAIRKAAATGLVDGVTTIPEALFFQLFRHPLTDLGLAQFARDWEKVPK
jgi:transaldolase